MNKNRSIILSYRLVGLMCLPSIAIFGPFNSTLYTAVVCGFLFLIAISVAGKYIINGLWKHKYAYILPSALGQLVFSIALLFYKDHHSGFALFAAVGIFVGYQYLFDFLVNEEYIDFLN